MTPDWRDLPPNVPLRDGRCDLGGETRCAARERDGSRCLASAEPFTYAGLCRRHHRLIARGVKIVLANGTRLDRVWTKASRHGRLLPPARA